MRCPRLFLVAVLALVASGLAVAPASADSVPAEPMATVVVRPATAIDDASMSTMARIAGVSVEETLDAAGLVRLQATAEGLAALEAAGLIDAVASDVPFFTLLDDSTATIEADTAQSNGFDGTGAIVAVIDSGVDTSHAAFTGRVVAEACFLSSIGGTCPGGGSTSTSSGSAAPCSTTGFFLDCAHGTHVAGIAVSAASPIEGVAPGAGLVAIRVMKGGAANQGPTGISSLDVLDAMNHVLSLAQGGMNIASVNISLGGTPSLCNSSSETAIWNDIADKLNAEGVAVVAASGNDADGFFPTTAVAFPACVDKIFSVGATERDAFDGLAPGTDPEVTTFSQYGGGLDLVAPGYDIESAVTGGGTSDLSGTSMAAPHVAGAFALLKSTQSGAWTPERFMELLRTTGSMVRRFTPDPNEPGDRYPEIRMSDALAFEPFSDASGGFWVIAADWAKYTGVSAGFGDNRYDPNGTLTRAQAVTLLWRMMDNPAPVGPNPFNDVPDGAFFTAAVTWAAEQGITAGKSDGFFAPDLSVTRAEMATFMWRLVGSPTGAPNAGFTDVPAGAFYETAVNWMASTGITLGTSPTTFSPDQTIDRAQMITFMHRLVNNAEAWANAPAESSFVMF
ncbi:MAG: S8 family serine peptidase [Actinomycetota bacterium]